MCDAANSEDPVAQRRGRSLHSIARDEQPRTGEGSGVETSAIGVGLHEADPRRRGAELSGRDLDMRGRGALAEFDGADGDLVHAVVAQGDPGLGDVLGRRRGLVQ